jgi:hypothetical protein
VASVYNKYLQSNGCLREWGRSTPVVEVRVRILKRDRHGPSIMYPAGLLGHFVAKDSA